MSEIIELSDTDEDGEMESEKILVKYPNNSKNQVTVSINDYESLEPEGSLQKKC